MHGGEYGDKRSAMYLGQKPLSALKVINKILKSILKLIDSQCKRAKTGVMCSRLFFLVKSLAAEFCTVCSLSRDTVKTHKRAVAVIQP